MQHGRRRKERDACWRSELSGIWSNETADSAASGRSERSVANRLSFYFYSKDKAVVIQMIVVSVLWVYEINLRVVCF